MNSGTTFVSCSFKDERYMQIFQWDYGRTPLNDCNYVSRISEYGFACAISGTEYLLITGMVLDKAVEQTTVIVALCGDEAAGAIPILDEMNSTNTKYRYDYTHYGSSSDCRWPGQRPADYQAAVPGDSQALRGKAAFRGARPADPDKILLGIRGQGCVK